LAGCRRLHDIRTAMDVPSKAASSARLAY